jgi:hypothetical protein
MKSVKFYSNGASTVPRHPPDPIGNPISPSGLSVHYQLKDAEAVTSRAACDRYTVISARDHVAWLGLLRQSPDSMLVRIGLNF